MGVFDPIQIVLVNCQGLTEILFGIQHHQRGHQLGEGGNGAHLGGIFLIERLARVDIKNQRAAGANIQFGRVGGGVDPRQSQHSHQADNQRYCANPIPHTTDSIPIQKRR